MIVNGSVKVDCDQHGEPIKYTEQDAQKRAKALALDCGEGHTVCGMEYVFGEQGKMITERITPMRTPDYKPTLADAE